MSLHALKICTIRSVSNDTFLTIKPFSSIKVTINPVVNGLPQANKLSMPPRSETTNYREGDSMFKSHTPFRMALLTACFLPATHLSADVLSSVTTPHLVEPVGIYDSSAPTLLNMRVKTVIGTGACVAGTYDGCTLNDVLNDIDGSDDFKPEIKVHMTADDFPDDGLVSNAELRQRGATSRGAPQKSFRVKLDSSDDLWRGERRIQLVKSFGDFSRIRNKLSYDLFADIPNLPSMQTQFVNFKVEDQGNVEDYGLYTHVE